MKVQREGDQVVLRMTDKEAHRFKEMLMDVSRGYLEESNEQGMDGDPGSAEAFEQDAVAAERLAKAIDAKINRKELAK